MKILDCTLRDGGYYTNWDFDNDLVKVYFESFNHLPIDFLEIGYKAFAENYYKGEFYYLPLFLIKKIKSISNKNLAILLNGKDLFDSNIEDLLLPCVGLIDLVRVAIDPKDLNKSLTLLKRIKSLGFKVALNVMYMSKWKTMKSFLTDLPLVNEACDFFYMVDSYGSVYPEDVKEITQTVKSILSIPLGFHGHNNLEMALINSLTALEYGVEIIDSTVTGMGRGAGNLKTELILTHLSSKGLLEFDFNYLSNLVDKFSQLQKLHNWGTNLPYMVSGSNSLPQKDVMEWITKRFYSLNSIVEALQNQKSNLLDKPRVERFKPENKFENVLLIGGGNSVQQHFEAIRSFVYSNKSSITIVHASSTNAYLFKDLDFIPQYFCLVGNEGHRLERVYNNSPFKGICILPPPPRKLGIYKPEIAKDKIFEIEESTINHMINDTHTILAFEISSILEAKNVYLVGYDGYPKESITSKMHEMFIENQNIFNLVKNRFKLISLLPTLYDLKIISLYSLIE